MFEVQPEVPKQLAQVVRRPFGRFLFVVRHFGQREVKVQFGACCEGRVRVLNLKIQKCLNDDRFRNSAKLSIKTVEIGGASLREPAHVVEKAGAVRDVEKTGEFREKIG